MEKKAEFHRVEPKTTTSYRIRPTVKELAEAAVKEKFGEDVGLSSIVESALMAFLGITEEAVKAFHGEA
jgi:hypothetical protein